MIDFFDAQQWFVVNEMAAGVFVIGEPLHPEDVRSHLVVGQNRAVLIDTGTGIGNIRAVVDQLTALPVSVINSHAHWDHIGGNWRFSEIAIHPAEARWLDDPGNTPALRASSTVDRLAGPLPPGVAWEELDIPSSAPTSFLTGGEHIDLGGVVLEVIHAPGHAPGLLAFLDRLRGVLFSTDVVYPGPLYAYSEETNLSDYVSTLAMLSELAPSLRLVLPCHNGDSMPPALIEAMHDAMVEVIHGRTAERSDTEKAIHDFGAFSIYAPRALSGKSAG